MRFGRIAADVHRRLGVLHVVVRIGHRAVAPRVRDARDGGGVADARLVVAVVGAPEAHELAQQVGLFVVVFGGANPVHAVRASGLAQLEQFGADFVEGGFPADALVLAVHQLHGVTQAELAVAVLAQRSTFGAMRAEVDRGVEHRFLTHPDTVFHHGVHGATHGAVGTHGTFDFDLARAIGVDSARGLGFFHQAQLRGGQAHTNAQT